MKKIELSKLIGARDANQVKIAGMQGTIAGNYSKIKQAEADRLAALRAKDQTAAHVAQFAIESMQLENTDLEEKIQELKAIRPSKEQTDAAWKADLIENSEYLAEMSMFQTVSALYDAVCVRAQNEEREWGAFAHSLDTLRTGGYTLDRKYWAPSPRPNLEVFKYGQPDSNIFHSEGNPNPIIFDPDGIDRLIGLLQSIKQNGVDSVL